MATNELVTDPNQLVDKLEDAFGISMSSIATFGAGAVFLLFLIILAVYKYCNREEGSYRIDESKNCGPFAELDMPLNGGVGDGLRKCGGGKKSSKNRRTGNNNNNKEWFV